MTLDCGENEDDEWVSSALLRAEEERVKVSIQMVSYN